MLSDEAVREIIDEIGETSKAKILVAGAENKVIAAINIPMQELDRLIHALEDKNYSEIQRNYHMEKSYDKSTHSLRFTIFVRADDSEVLLAKSLGIYLPHIYDAIEYTNYTDGIYKKVLQDKQYDLKRILYSKAVPLERPMVTAVISVDFIINEKYLDRVRRDFDIGYKESVICMSLNELVIIKHFKNNFADILYEMSEKHIKKERHSDIYIGIGNEVDHWTSLKHSYQCAKMAILYAKYYTGSQRIQCYTKLGLGHFLFGFLEDEEEKLVKEVFNEKYINLIRLEEIKVVCTFIRSAFNCSIAATKCHLNRKRVKTIVKKYSEITGFDLTDFNSAINFLLAAIILESKIRADNSLV